MLLVCGFVCLGLTQLRERERERERERVRRSWFSPSANTHACLHVRTRTRAAYARMSCVYIRVIPCPCLHSCFALSVSHKSHHRNLDLSSQLLPPLSRPLPHIPHPLPRSCLQRRRHPRKHSLRPRSLRTLCHSTASTRSSPSITAPPSAPLPVCDTARRQARPRRPHDKSQTSTLTSCSRLPKVSRSSLSMLRRRMGGWRVGRMAGERAGS
jgi:hypothetical protein